MIRVKVILSGEGIVGSSDLEDKLVSVYDNDLTDEEIIESVYKDALQIYNDIETPGDRKALARKFADQVSIVPMPICRPEGPSYLCIWGDGYSGNPKVETHQFEWFSESRGYGPEELGAIKQLGIGEDWTNYESGVHIIIRVS